MRLETYFNNDKKEININGVKGELENQIYELSKENNLYFILNGSQTKSIIDDIIELENNTYRIEIKGFTIDIKVDDPIKKALSVESEIPGEIMAPMSGLISKVLIKEGEKISKNDTLVVISAMKMENQIKAPINGIVTKVMIKENQQVSANEILIVLKPQ